MSPEKPEKIGHYTIVSQLGRGGMGIVYKAREESLNRFVAIKVLTEQLTEDKTFLQRFVREAQAAAGLSHPNIVNIFFIGEDEGRPYFVMEYVTGRSLHQMIGQEGRIGNPRSAQLMLQAAHGLAAAHDRGIIHRDIKPANLMLDDRGMLKIADFGLALPAGAEARLTATGTLMGTPGYLAPEQCRGEQIDNRTDIYALGVTFYELLAGKLPFRGESPLALLRQILDEEAPDIATLAPDVDSDTRVILEKMIAKDRAKRYQDCHALVVDLEDYLARQGVRSMTAGLSARKPGLTPPLSTAATQSAATEVLAAGTQKPATPVRAQDTPTTFGTSTADPTLPVAPYVQPDTLVPPSPGFSPAREQAPFEAPATVVQGGGAPPASPAHVSPSRSSSRAMVIVLVLALLIGGGTVAGFFAISKIRRTTTASQQIPGAMEVSVATSPKPSTTAVNAQLGTQPPPETLLAQGMNATTLESVGDGPLLMPNLPTATVNPEVAPGAHVATQSGTQRTTDPGRDRTRSEESRTTPPVSERRSTGGSSDAPSVRSVSALNGVAVAVTGDPGLTGAVSSALTSELEAAELEVVDAQGLPATEDLLRGGDVLVSRLIDRLRNEGLAVLVLARVEPSGQRELNYLGRQETAYSARITLTTYDLATGRPIGSRGNASIEYTSRTADRESEKVVGRLARSSAAAIQNR